MPTAQKPAPYVAGAGTPPPYLAGRNAITAQFTDNLTALEDGISRNPLALLGYRGLGKTVLLGELGMIARERGWHVAFVEVDPSARLEQQLLDALDTTIREIAPARRAAASLATTLGAATKSVSIGTSSESPVSLQFSMTSDPGAKTTGTDLFKVLDAISRLAQNKGSGLVLLLDELHETQVGQLRSLAIALQAFSKQRDVAPFALVGAGLPQLDKLAMQARTYGERMFEIRNVPPLGEGDVHEALRKPARRRGRDWSDDALATVAAETQGYPFFVQLWGHDVWNATRAKVIEAKHVEEARPRVLRHLDESFYRQRMARLTSREREFVLAMAALEPEERTTGNVARALGKRTTSVSSLREQLITRGFIEAPSFGTLAFTVPGLADHIKRSPTANRGLGFT